jgi:uncharacterized protein (DUF1800 family)
MYHKVRLGIAVLSALALVGCGGGGGSSSPSPQPGPVQPPVSTISEADAARFLTQATFGPKQGEVQALTTKPINTWISEQIALPVGASAVAHMDARLIELRAANANANLGTGQFYEYFWREAVTAPDQLRQRMRFALSQIFVVSLADPVVDVRGAGSYYDMLGRNALGNYRTLLEEVSLHPIMGRYLTHLANQKEDPVTGRTPDENYAREVLQLMSVGLVALNSDGTPQRDSAGNTIPAYTASDVSNLAKVFTGFSYSHPTPSANSFNNRVRIADYLILPMIAYPEFHSVSAKTFLGTTIPASATSDPNGDLRIALDTIFNHPNTGPFVSKQLIQRLVTSNPSPAYVGRVAGVFANNGQGVRGDLAAVARAILTDSEARTLSSDPNYGKLREPILRMTHMMRAFDATSQTGNFLLGSTSASNSLGQSALTAPSVFNFWRPGYSPPNTKTGAAGLVAPEFQIVDEVTTAGYLNTLQTALTNGIGTSNDVRTALSAETALAETPSQLVDRLSTLLVSGQMSTGLRQRIIDTVTGIAIPAGTNVTQAQIDAAKLNRARLAVFLTMASPEYLVQR